MKAVVKTFVAAVRKIHTAYFFARRATDACVSLYNGAQRVGAQAFLLHANFAHRGEAHAENGAQKQVAAPRFFNTALQTVRKLFA